MVVGRHSAAVVQQQIAHLGAVRSNGLGCQLAVYGPYTSSAKRQLLVQASWLCLQLVAVRMGLT
jgi:hypothetical protein